MGRGDHRVAAAGHVAADAVDRDVLVAETDAGKGFDLDIAQGVLLRLGEAADLGLGELDVGDDLVGQTVDQGLDLIGAEAEGGGFPFVEFRRQFADGRITSCGDVFEDGFDGLADLAVGLGFFRLGCALLECPDHLGVLRLDVAR